MSDDDRFWMKKICGLCPYSRTNTLFLHPERAEEFAYQAQNPYNDFVCHKTGVVDEEGEGDIVRAEHSFTCCGFLSLQVNEGARCPEGFTPDPNAFDCADDMIMAHTDHWEDKQRRRRS